MELALKSPISFMVISVLFGVSACSWFFNWGQPNVPADAVSGVEPNSVRFIGNYQLSNWATNVSPSATLSLFEAKLVSTGAREYRVFYRDDKESFYVGVLSSQLGLSGLQTILIDLGQERCIIGWVSPDYPGNLKYVYFEPFDVDPIRRLDLRKSSEISDNFFILPLKENVDLWNNISTVAIQTEESLRDRPNGKGSVAEKTFDSGLDVSTYFINIAIQP